MPAIVSANVCDCNFNCFFIVIYFYFIKHFLYNLLLLNSSKKFFSFILTPRIPVIRIASSFSRRIVLNYKEGTTFISYPTYLLRFHLRTYLEPIRSVLLSNFLAQRFCYR